MVHTASAEPQELYIYSNFAVGADDKLQHQGEKLQSVLGHFQSKCREADLRVSAQDSGRALSQYGEACRPFDAFVGEVGRRFARADGLQSVLGTSVYAVVGSGVLTAAMGIFPALFLAPPLWLLTMLSRTTWLGGLGSPAASEVGSSSGSASFSELLTEEWRTTTVNLGIGAEAVPTSDEDIVMYKHNSETPGVNSNCTWYAAAAVKTASGGKINIGSTLSLGNAGQWARNALAAITETDPLHDQYKQYSNVISGVDRVPNAGSVYCAGGHVAYVEEAKLVEKDGKQSLEVVLSEENYYYRSLGSFMGSEPVEVPGDTSVKRWRRTKIFSVVDGQVGEDQGLFIHFAYEEN